MPLPAAFLPCGWGKEMQFFDRANLAKCLLYAINGGVDEVSKKQVGPAYRPHFVGLSGVWGGYGAV